MSKRVNDQGSTNVGGHVSRRQFLKAGAARRLCSPPSCAFSRRRLRAGAGPEVTAAKLGFIALTDASPLFVAKEKGMFAKYGMPDVEVPSRPPGARRATISCWAREGNGIDGAHILTPMPYLISPAR